VKYTLTRQEKTVKIFAVRLFTGKNWHTVRTYSQLTPALDFAKECLTAVEWDIKEMSLEEALKIEKAQASA
jgi:hypothetical protein